MFCHVITEQQTCQACHEKIIVRSMYNRSVTNISFVVRSLQVDGWLVKYNLYVLISDVCCPQLYISGYESILWCLMDSTSRVWTKVILGNWAGCSILPLSLLQPSFFPLTMSRLMTWETANITNTSKMIVILYAGEESPILGYPCQCCFCMWSFTDASFSLHRCYSSMTASKHTAKS